MRFLVAILVIVAAAKVAVRDHLSKAGLAEAVITAHRERAVDTCRIEGQAARDQAAVRAIGSPTNISMRTGDPTRHVMLWQIDHADWHLRYRNPQLVLTHDKRAGRFVCVYDVLLSTAILMRA